MVADLPLVYHPNYSAPLPSTHRFPMAKFRLLHERLLREGVARPDQFYCPEKPPQVWIEQVHLPDYIRGYSDGALDERAWRRIGLPWSPALVDRTWVAVGGTILTARLALERGVACNLAGGTHHAFPDFGAGFCIFNDVAIALRLLLAEGRIQRALIVDLDVHQGDGTAVIFQDDPRVFTFSMHCQSNFPARKQISDLDVPLPDGLEDDDYLRTLADYLPGLLEQIRPDLVFYNAGVDPHQGDRLGKLALTDTGLFRREMQVLETCMRAGYPVACVLGGGYCEDFDALVYRHSLCQRAASDVLRRCCL